MMRLVPAAGYRFIGIKIRHEGGILRMCAGFAKELDVDGQWHIAGFNKSPGGRAIQIGHIDIPLRPLTPHCNATNDVAFPQWQILGDKNHISDTENGKMLPLEFGLYEPRCAANSENPARFHAKAG